MSKLLIVAPYPEKRAPSQRFRFEQYIDLMRDTGVEVRVVSFWSDRHWPAIYRKGQLPLKIYATIEGFLRRFLLLFVLARYDAILVHREATPIGWPWWEWAAAKIWGKILIYDFDDAVWLSNSSSSNARLVGGLKNHGKTAKIISWSQRVFAGNAFLAAYARQFSGRVDVVPTTIDTAHLHNRVKKHTATKLPMIGWTGTHSTLKQLMPLMPLLEKLHQTIPFKFLLIADQVPDALPDFVNFKPWNKSTEIDDLLQLDIGIMPLFDTDWERGKCGFKALQYMALGIPSVVSDVGVNAEIVDDGVNGFLCEAMPLSNSVLWEKALTALLTDHALRASLGAAGRNTIIEKYSVKSQTPFYLSLVS